MDVLGTLLQLGERREGVAGLGVQRIIDFQQDRAVALHDQRIGGIVLHGLLAGSGLFTGLRRRIRRSLARETEYSIVDAQSRSRKVGFA